MKIKNEKNIPHGLKSAKDDLNIKEQPKKITVAVYCRVGRAEQLSGGYSTREDFKVKIQ